MRNTETGAAASDQRLLDALAGIFACSPDTARLIEARAADRRYAPGAVILRQGDPAGETYLMVAGRARAQVYGAEGQQVLLGDFTAGDIFGAIAWADATPQEADVVSVEAVRAALFLALDFLGLIERHSCVGLAVSRMLLSQLRAANSRMVEGVSLSAAGRVHAELLRLARAGDGKTISPPPVMAALAVRIHSTRETVSRTVSALERRGLVRREKDALILVSPQRIEELVI